jgi:hypothetical protein
MQRRLYLVWDDNGLEVCEDLTGIEAECEQAEKEQIWEILKDPDTVHGNPGAQKLAHLYHATTMRARINGQRNYEIYLVTVDETVDQQDFRELFDTNTSYVKQLVRDRGVKVW